MLVLCLYQLGFFPRDVQLHHAAMQPSDAAVIGDISAWRPDSMSWSNVPEYMVPQVR
jgi:RPA family protein